MDIWRDSNEDRIWYHYTPEEYQKRMLESGVFSPKPEGFSSFIEMILYVMDKED